MSVTTVELTEEMATTVLIVEWMVKQLQLLKEKQRQIEALQQENEQLKDSLDKLKNRDSQNSSIPPSQDLFAIAELCELLSLAGRSPPGLHST